MLALRPTLPRHGRTGRLALAIAFALPSTVFAQAPDDADTTSLDRIIVTGTSARDRTVLESTAPIDVLTRDDIRKAGVLNGELGSALAVLLPSFNFPRQSNSGGADHVRAAQLRGLSPDQVLVLVNGKRRHVSALVNTGSKAGRGTTPVDFNAIPVSAISRIEVLRDGAGAQYGSDAVAGVINVILDSTPEGGAWEASYGAHHTDVEPIDDTVTDGQSLFISGNVGTGIGDGGFVRGGLEYKDRNATNRAGFDTLPFFEEQTPANQATIGQRNYVLGDGASEDLNAWLNSELPIGDSALYAFGTYNQRDSEGANYFRYPDGVANFPEVYPNGYRPISVGENRDFSAVTGLRGVLGEWDYDASLNYGSNGFEYGLRNSLNASLGPNSPTEFKTGEYEFAQTLFNFDLTRGVDAGDRYHTLATGFEARHETYHTRAGDPASYAAGPFTDRPTGSQAGGGLTPQDEADLRRDVFGVYAALSSEWTDAFTTDIATRYERYSDFGGEFTGKLAARYEFVPAFALRGALSNNVRAPSLSQIGYEATSTGYDASGRLTQGRLLSVNNPIAQALGAKPLEAETSINGSLGFTSRIGENFDVSFDLFRVDIEDRVTLSERITGDALEDFIEANFGITGIESANYFANAVDTETEGAELVANWRHELGGGNLLLTGAWSYAKTEITNIVATPAELLALGPDYILFGVEETNTLTDATPRTLGVLSANWASDRWSLLGRASRHGSATRVFNFGGGFEPRQTYGAEWQFDAEVEFKVTTQLSLALGGLNLTDEYPDLSSADIGYFGNLPYDVLSPIGSNGAYYYSRLRYTF